MRRLSLVLSFLFVLAGLAGAQTAPQPGYYLVPIPPGTVIPGQVTLGWSGPGTVSGEGLYAVGATVTLTATPDAGGAFSGWGGDPACAPTFTMPARNVICQGTFTGPPGGSNAPLTAAQLDNGSVDLAGQSTIAAQPNGVPDIHVQVSNVPQAVTGVVITRTTPLAPGDTNTSTGVWVSPSAGGHWVAAIQNPVPGVADLWFDPYTGGPTPYLTGPYQTYDLCVALTYADGGTAKVPVNAGVC